MVSKIDERSPRSTWSRSSRKPNGFFKQRLFCGNPFRNGNPAKWGSSLFCNSKPDAASQDFPKLGFGFDPFRKQTDVGIQSNPLPLSQLLLSALGISPQAPDSRKVLMLSSSQPNSLSTERVSAPSLRPAKPGTTGVFENRKGEAIYRMESPVSFSTLPIISLSRSWG